MEPQHEENGQRRVEAGTPELPPPHLLLDLGGRSSEEAQAQNGTDKTDHGIHSSVLDRQQDDATCEEASEISSTLSSGIPRPASAAGTGIPQLIQSPTSPSPNGNNDVVERRRRTPSTPRASSGIPRLSSTESGRRSARTSSECRQRPMSDMAKDSQNPVTRSSNFGFNRRPQSAMHERSKTDPSNGESDLRRTPRSNTSSTSSLHSASGGRRMEIKSKIGSLDNAKHKPGGGKVKIFNEKKDLSTVGSKCGSKDYIKHKPGGGNVQITDEKVNFRETAASKVGSLNNAKHKPGGGDVKIETVKVDFKERVTSKVGSLDNARHVPGGGDKKVYSEKVQWEVTSKVASLKNAKHKPGGGNIQIFSEVLPWTEPPKSGQKQIESEHLNFREEVQPKVGSFDNAHHEASGGNVED